jgi:ParB family chromosome partitioning protein
VRIAGDAVNVQTLPLDAIEPNPDQPRKRFNPDALQELADSIAVNGLLEPIIVRPDWQAALPLHYIIVAGERRWRACGFAGTNGGPDPG